MINGEGLFKVVYIIDKTKSYTSVRKHTYKNNEPASVQNF